MGLLSMLEQRSVENPSTSLANPAEWLLTGLGAQPSVFAGVSVSPQTAMRLGTVAACHRIIAESIASLSLHFYERLEPRGKRRAAEHPLYTILHDQANSEGMTAFTFRETAMHHLCGWGNAYAEIERDGAGRIVGLWPLLPDRTRVERKDGKKIFRTRIRDGKSERDVGLRPERVLHIPGLGFDGIKGYGYITLHRQMLGAALAAEEFAGRFFGNGMHLGMVVKVKGRLGADGKENLRTDMEILQGGLSQAHRIAILEEDMTVERLGVPPDEAQFLETRKYDREQIAMIYRVPLHLLQVGGKEAGQSFSSVEQKSLEFVIYTIRPWLVRWEQAIRAQLLSREEKAKYFAEHLVDSLLRGDYESRMKGHALRIANSLASYNDVAEIENWAFDETPAGDTRYIQLNMVPVDMAREALAPKSKEEPEPKQPGVRLLQARFGLLMERRSRSYAPIFHAAGVRIVTLETAALGRLAKKAINVADFISGAEAFYEQAFPPDTSRLLLPAVRSLGEVLADDLREWLRSDADLGGDLDRLAAAFVAEYTQRHREASCVELQAQIAARSGAPDVEALAEAWEQNRVEQIANEESARAGRFMARGLATVIGVLKAWDETQEA